MIDLNLFSNVKFNHKYHSYSISGQKLVNVSKLVKMVTPEFDQEYWSNRKAKERSISQEEILAEWYAKAQNSIRIGNETHAHIEQVLGIGNAEEANQFLALNERPKQCLQFDMFWEKSSKMMKPVAIEYVMGARKWGIAGTADCLMQSKLDDDYMFFWDWKTGSKFNIANGFAKLLPPFDDLDDCELNKYSLQISLYRFLLEDALNNEIGDSYIVYLTEDNYTVHKAIDLRERLPEWLKEVV